MKLISEKQWMINMKTKRKPIIKIGRTPNQISFALGYKKCKKDMESKVDEWLNKNLRIVNIGNKHYVVADNRFTTEYDFILEFKKMLKV